MTKFSKKLAKIVDIIIKLRVFRDWLFERNHGGGGGTGELTEREGGLGNSVVGANSAVEGNSEGGQQWGCLQPLGTALHTISISLQNSLS